MKILFVITGLGMGGAEILTTGLADLLIEKGNEVRIISLNGEPIVSPKNKNIEITNLRMKKNPLDFFSKLIQFHFLVKKFNPDIIHSHMFHANIFSRIYRIFNIKVPLVCTAHNKNEGGSLRMLTYRITDSLCTITTNVSQEAVDEFIKLKASPERKIICIHNGIDTEKFKKNLESRQITRKSLGLKDEKILLAVGRLTQAKDYPNLIEAFNILIKEQKNLKLLIVGAGEEEKNIINLIKKYELSNNIQLLGIRRDIENIYNAADYFVLSSEWEGFGLVVAEAMSTELIAVATDSGGVREVMGTNDFLCPPKNSKFLAEKIKLALKLPDHLYQEKSRAARNHILENFSINKKIQDWLELYHTIKNRNV